MKKLSFILAALFFSLALNAQTEDEVYIGKGKTFGNYNGKGIIIPDFGRNTNTVGGQTLTGIVTGVSKPAQGKGTATDSRIGITSFNLQKDNGTTVTIGTGDHGFTVPGNLIGKKIMVQGSDFVSGRKRYTPEKENQKDIQFVATGLIVN